MQIGLVEIELDEDIEVKGPQEVWVWKRSGEIHVIRSKSDLVSILVREWKERNRQEEEFSKGSGI